MHLMKGISLCTRLEPFRFLKFNGYWMISKLIIIDSYLIIYHTLKVVHLNSFQFQANNVQKALR